MTENEKKEIAELVEIAKELAEYDPQAFMLLRSNMSILKARADMEHQERATA